MSSYFLSFIISSLLVNVMKMTNTEFKIMNKSRHTWYCTRSASIGRRMLSLLLILLLTCTNISRIFFRTPSRDEDSLRMMGGRYFWIISVSSSSLLADAILKKTLSSMANSSATPFPGGGGGPDSDILSDQRESRKCHLNFNWFSHKSNFF